MTGHATYPLADRQLSLDDSAAEALEILDRFPWLRREIRLRAREPWRPNMRPALRSLEITIADLPGINEPGERRLWRALHDTLTPLLEGIP
jgi:hypothetical protein